MPDARALLVSIKPEYAELLLSGTKTVELRRVRPDVGVGAHVLLYASSPARQMVGLAQVQAIDVDEPDAIWSRHAGETGITRSAYDAYFDGTNVAVAITLTEVRRLDRQISLAELRRRMVDFRPPQSFRYLPSTQVHAFT